MWQEIIVAICVLTALLFLLRSYLPNGVLGFGYFSSKKSASCEGCSSCGKEKKCGSVVQ